MMLDGEPIDRSEKRRRGFLSPWSSWARAVSPWTEKLFASEEAVSGVAAAIGIAALEHAALARASPLHHLWRWLKTAKLRVLAPHFEPEFYLGQIRSASRRRLAARDPLLHYAVVGWREHRSPNRTFDPRFIKDDLFAGLIKGDPLAFMLHSADRIRMPHNEVQASCATPASFGKVERRALVFHHGRGGGSSKYLGIFEADLRRRAIMPIRLRLVSLSDKLVVLEWGATTRVFDLTTEAGALAKQVADLEIDLVIVSHIIDFNEAIFAFIPSLVERIDAELWFILHDYFSVCPRVNMVTSDGRPCGGPSVNACVACVSKGGSDAGAAAPGTWRSRFAALLSHGDRILVPSGDTQRRLAKFLTAQTEVWSPEADHDYPSLVPSFHETDKLRVGILGGLNVAKGARVVLELARLIQRVGAPIEIVLFGPSSMTRQLKRAGVSVEGRYSDANLKALLQQKPPQIVFLPAIWPETWSFVLTSALEAGLTVMAFAHGAQMERLQRLGRDQLLLPIDCFDRPDVVLSRLLSFRAAHLDAHLRHVQHKAL